MDRLVAEIMGLIEAGADDPRLRWSPDRMTVQVVFSLLVLNGGPNVAASGRRAPFGDAWQAAMAGDGGCGGPNGCNALTGPGASSGEMPQVPISRPKRAANPRAAAAMLPPRA